MKPRRPTGPTWTEEPTVLHGALCFRRGDGLAVISEYDSVAGRWHVSASRALGLPTDADMREVRQAFNMDLAREWAPPRSRARHLWLTAGAA